MSDRYESYDAFDIDFPIERVLRITFNNPQTYNSLDAKGHRQLTYIWRDIDLDPQISAVIVTGAGKTGSEIVSHPDINKMAFTGSTAVGKIIQKSLAGSNKKYTLELGGKAAHIIFDDAAINQAVEGIVNGIFFNQGHVCCAGSRLYIQERVAEEVIPLID